ncbi:FAD-dependent oxidoreductase [Clostridium sp.]|uniref:NAD(P)/FAD-dependent oxidoreductase n=1 Tax=Clostridium sp. TaxID=1506 RepID=UPI0026282D62|nr:FAD-dependent oxidoreductase [Clostridium sp.]
MSKNIVIIGGGIAAVSAIKSIREIDKEINIYVFQNEKYLPYYRTKLTKSLFGNLEEDKILLQKKEWYDSNNVKLCVDKEVTFIDTINNKIQLEDKTFFEYDKLLIATGARNFTPPIDGINKKNIFTIRELNDVEAIKANIEDKETILNIGGGIQGLEAAWAFSQNNKNVIVVEALERLMPRQLDRRASEVLQSSVENSNIKVLLNSNVEKILGEDKAEGISLKDGNNIDCDMIVYSVGIRANTKLLENKEVKINKGIVVNNKMQTNIENIYAAGDVAELPGQIGGLWNVASGEGKVAGYNMVGKEVKYSNLTPITMMNAFNISLFSMGDIDEENYDKTIVEDNKDELTYKRLFLKDNKIIGAILLGDTKSSMILKKAIENKTKVPNMDSLESFNDIISELKR